MKIRIQRILLQLSFPKHTLGNSSFVMSVLKLDLVQPTALNRKQVHTVPLNNGWLDWVGIFTICFIFSNLIYLLIYICNCISQYDSFNLEDPVIGIRGEKERIKETVKWHYNTIFVQQLVVVKTTSLHINKVKLPRLKRFENVTITMIIYKLKHYDI